MSPTICAHCSRRSASPLKALSIVITQLRYTIAEYRLTARDLYLDGLRGCRLLAKPPVPLKYQDPRTGKTWSGRGKPPKWIAGKNRERFLIP